MLKSHLRITIFLNNQLNDTQKNKIVFKKTQKTIFKIRLSSTYFCVKSLSQMMCQTHHWIQK